MQLYKKKENHGSVILECSLDSIANGKIAADIAKAGLATAIILSPLAAITCTFGDNLFESSISVWCSPNMACKIGKSVNCN